MRPAGAGQAVPYPRLTAAAHLARRDVPVRRAGLDSAQTKEAARLYQAGWTLVQLGRRFEVDAQTVRRTIARQGRVDPTGWTTTPA
ncbi:hypothetical protein JCM18909_213 [Cutibacterium acnes JCM 18909]|nr:hypothetical protein JCM18909_213 [Cutibacterium acnes JCM 18909]